MLLVANIGRKQQKLVSAIASEEKRKESVLIATIKN